MQQSSTSSVHTQSQTTSTDALDREQFAAAMSGVSWWATSTQGEQQCVEEMYADSGEQLADFVAMCGEYASATELLDGEDADAEADDEEQATEPTPAAQEPAPTHTLQQANATLAAFGRQCRTAADHNYRAAALAAQFVDEFLGAAPGKSTRTTAVERLAAEWLLWDEESMAVPQATAMKTLRARVNVLLRVNAVASLLGDGRGVAKGDGSKKGRGKGKADGPLPWGTLREFSPLVERQADDYRETWGGLPHVAEKAKQLVAEVASSGMARADVVKAVAALVEEEQRERLANARRQAEADQAEADQAREAEMAARKAAADAKREADAAAEKAKDGTPESADAAAKALATLREEQAKAKAATEAAALAAQKAAQREREEADAAKRQAEADAKRAAKEAKAKEREERPAAVAPPTPTASQGTNLLASAKMGTAKDVAGMALELIVGSDEPDTVFEALLDALDGHKELSKATHRAIKAARLAVSHKPGVRASASPAAVATVLEAVDTTAAAHVNGQLAAIAS
jgi:hypothetical protein